MKKTMRFMWELIIAVVVTGVIAYVLYLIVPKIMPVAIRLQKEAEVRQLTRGSSGRRHDFMRDIAVENDLGEVVYAKLSNGEIITVKSGDNILRLRGNATIFVPKMKGWYTVHYPFPYPFVGNNNGYMVFVYAPLSQLITSVNTGNVEVKRTRTEKEINESEPLEKVMVKDIKVTFRPGEAPQNVMK